MRKYILIIVLFVAIFAAAIFLKYRKVKVLDGLGKVKSTDRPPKLRIVYSNKNKELKKIKTSNDIYEILKEIWSKQIETREEMLILLLNRSNQVLGHYMLSMGGITETVADIRLIYAVALNSLSTAIVLVHNHPSGNLNASQSDIAITRKVKEAGKIMDITLLDHIIMTKNGYYSFADEGIL